jgi:uncharacterized protein
VAASADVRVVERYYAALAAWDLDTAAECFLPDAVWHIPGSNAISGTHRGWPAIRDGFLSRLGPLSGGSFRARLVDVAVGSEYVVAIQHATAEHDGRRLDLTACHLMRLRAGRIAEVSAHYSDQAMLDAFWRA